MGKYDFDFIVSEEQMKANREKMTEEVIEYEKQEKKTVRHLLIVLFILISLFFLIVAIGDDMSKKPNCTGNAIVGICHGIE